MRALTATATLPLLLSLLSVVTGAPVATSSESSLTSSVSSCLESARSVHGQRNADAELNHFIACLQKNTKQELKTESRSMNSASPSDEAEVLSLSDSLAKIIASPYFTKNKAVKRSASEEPAQLDESMLATLVSDPDAIQMLRDYIAKKTVANLQKAASQQQKRPHPPKHQRHQQPHAERRTSSPQGGLGGLGGLGWLESLFDIRPIRHEKPHQRNKSAKDSSSKESSLNPLELLPKPTETKPKPRPSTPDMPEMEKLIKHELVETPPRKNTLGDVELFGPGDFKVEKPYDDQRKAGSDSTQGVLPWQLGNVPVPRK